MSKFSAYSGLSFSVGMMETRLALPQRSPSPLSVPWICRAPARTAAKLIRHRLFRVIMGVNADAVAGDFGADLADDFFNLVRQRAAIGVAKNHPARAFVVRRLGAGQRIGRIGLVAVEEMFAVEQHLTAFGFGRAHAVADRGEILLLGGFERDAHVIVPGFGDEADGVGLGRQ